MNIAFIGPSGVGKGTHADKLSARYNLQHISTGDLLRQNLESHSALGILARKYMEQGELVPDEVVDAMIEESVRRLGHGPAPANSLGFSPKVPSEPSAFAGRLSQLPGRARPYEPITLPTGSGRPPGQP